MRHLIKHASHVIKHLHKHKHHYALATFGSFAVVKMLALFAGFFGLMQLGSTYAATPIVRDGGGSTNNWTEAANRVGDTLPTSTSIVTFTSTYTKNVLIDTGVNVYSFDIQS